MADLSLEGLERLRVEWQAWRTVCHELERVGVNLNDDERLAVSIQRWGEELSDLRGTQSQDVNDKALAERRARFDEVGLVLAEQ